MCRLYCIITSVVLKPTAIEQSLIRILDHIAWWFLASSVCTYSDSPPPFKLNYFFLHALLTSLLHVWAVMFAYGIVICCQWSIVVWLCSKFPCPHHFKYTFDHKMGKSNMCNLMNVAFHNSLFNLGRYFLNFKDFHNSRQTPSNGK